MQIINDRIQFVADDFAGLSADAKAALIPYCGSNPFHSLLSDTANNHVATAQRLAWSSSETVELRPLVVNFRNATDQGKANAVTALEAVIADLGAAVKVEEIALDSLPGGELIK